MPFVLREITFFLFDKQRLVGSYRAGVVLFFFKIIIFVKDGTETERMCLQVCSWEGLPCICQSSGLQLCPNAFYTPVKRLLL